MSNETNNQSIPNGWQNVELGEITDIVYGVQAAVAQNLDSSIGLPILTNVNITNAGTIDLEKLRYYDLPQKKREALILQKGDLLFNWRSGSQDHVGKTALFDLEGEYTFSSFILRLRPKEKIFNQFLHLYLYYIKANGFFSSKRRQSSINSVFNASVAAKTPIAFPPLPEQKAIAKVLRSVQEAREARQTELRLERERKNALMDYLFTHGTRGESLKLTEISEMPESWNVVKLKDVCLKTKNVNPTKNPDDYFIYIDVSSVSNKSFKIIENNSVLGADAPSRARKLIETNDVIFATVRPTMKRVAMIPEKLSGQVCSTGFCVVKANPKLLVPTFAFYCLLMDRIEKSVEKLQKGASYPAISDSDLLNQLIPFPPFEEQNEIAEVLQACDEKISALEKEINMLDEFFKAMLEELMSGNLSSVPLIEN